MPQRQIRTGTFMKLKILAVSLLAFFALCASATALQAPLVTPEPISPAEGTRYYIESTTDQKAVIVTASVGGVIGESEWVEASLSSAANSDGSFSNPLAYRTEAP